MDFLNPFKNPHQFSADKIPSLTGKVCVVTGGNATLGLECVRQFAKHGAARVYLAARSRAKYDKAIESLKSDVPLDAIANIKFLELDLASFTSIKAAAEAVLRDSDRLDILMNNAGVMALPPGFTKEGYETQFGTNHLGHALFTKLLMPLLLRTAGENGEAADVRIVNLTSGGEMGAPRGKGIVFSDLKTEMGDYHSYTRYGQSKLANILFTRELAQRYPNILSVAPHPGRVKTQLLDHRQNDGSWTTCLQGVFDKFARVFDVGTGALSQLWAATERGMDEKGKRLVKSGQYYWPVGVEQQGTKLCRDESLARRLWDWQEEEFKEHGF